jgi:hypothetical protein
LARIRTIKPEFFRHADLYEAEKETGLPLRLAFAGLWTAADREGRFKWRPRELKLDCLPHDDVDFSRVLDALTTRGWVVRYAVEGKEYGLIPSWQQHQVINNREKPSEIPDPNETNDLTREARVDDATTTPLKQVQVEGKGKEGEREIGSGEGSAPAKSKSLISPEAFETASNVLVAMGLDPHHPLSVGAPLTIQGWFNEHWRSECILIGVKRGMQSRNGDPPGTLKYFEKAIARAHAELTPSLPTVEFRDAETITVTSHGKPKNPIIQASDDLRRKLASFDGPARGIDELRSGEVASATRLLPHG